MNIPESIRIGGVEYGIVFEPFLSNENGHELLGQIRYQQGIIALSENAEMCHDVACMTLLHKVLHGVARHFDLALEDEETIVDAFARGLFQVLQDNADRLFDLKEGTDVAETVAHVDGAVILNRMRTGEIDY